MATFDLILILLILLLLILILLWIFLKINIISRLFRRITFFTQKIFLYILIVIEIILIFYVYQNVIVAGQLSNIFPNLPVASRLNVAPAEQFKSTGDYAKDIEKCNDLLYKHPSQEIYCYIAINSELGNGVIIYGAPITFEPSSRRAKDFFDQDYKRALKAKNDGADENFKNNPTWEKNKITEEPGPDNMKWIITRHADVKKINSYVYEYSVTLYLLQGKCAIYLDGGALKINDVQKFALDGDLNRLKQESVNYIRKVSKDLSKYCKEDSK